MCVKFLNRLSTPVAISETIWPTSQPKTPPTGRGLAIWQHLLPSTACPVVEAYMRHIQAAAARKMQLALARFPDGRYQFADTLDTADESVAVRATIDIRGGVGNV